MHLRVIHRTVYDYDYPASQSHSEVRLMPLTDGTQTCHQFHLEVEPAVRTFHYEEPGGPVHHFSVLASHRRLSIVAKSVVETRLSNPFDGIILDDNDWDQLDFHQLEQADYLTSTYYVPLNQEIAAIAREIPRRGSVADYAIDVATKVHSMLRYDGDATHVHTTLHDVLVEQAGVCQDFTHLALGCLRIAGIPCRYVSGYLYVSADDEMRGDHASHAWLECRLPGGRWMGVDPTNNVLADDRYIKIHTGRDYSDVSPTKGVYVGVPARDLRVSVEVYPIQLGMVTEPSAQTLT